MQVFQSHWLSLVVSADRPMLYDGLSGKQVRFRLPKEIFWQASDVSFWGDRMALGTNDGRVYIVGMHAPTRGHWLQGQQEAVDHLAFCSSGESLGTLSRGGALRFWLIGCPNEFGSVHVHCDDPIHLDYIHNRDAWMIVDRKQGLLLYRDDGRYLGRFALPNRSSVTAVATGMWSKSLVLVRKNGDVELWDSLSLVPALQPSMA